MPDYKTCPYCVEEISIDSKECIHCQSLLEETVSPVGQAGQSIPPPPKTEPPPPPEPPSSDYFAPSPKPGQAKSPQGKTLPPPASEQEISFGETPAVPYQTPPGKRRRRVPSSDGDFLKILAALFQGDDFSARQFARVDKGTSLLVMVGVALVGPLVSGLLGQFFFDLYVLTSLTSIVSYALLLGLLYGLFETKKDKVPLDAYLSLTAVAAVVLFVTSLLNALITVLPWTEIGYLVVGMVIYRYYNETYGSNKILKPLLVLTIWLILLTLVVNRFFMLLF